MIRPIGRARLSVSLAWITVILSGLSLMAGKVWVPLSVWGSDDLQWWIVFELRLPRAILGVGVGAVLGLSGAVLQGYLRNMLAAPGLIGVSSSAALGGVASIFLGLAAKPWTLSVCAMLGVGAEIALVGFQIGRAGGRGE